MVDVRVFSTIYQEGLLMQQQTLHELLQDLEQELLRSHVLVIKSVGLQITMQSKSDRNAVVSSFPCIYFA